MNKVNLAMRAGLIAAAFAGTVAAAQAQTNYSGTIESSINLVAGCAVNGTTVANGFSFGSLSFGTHATEFTNATAQVGGATGISVQCTTGVTATYTIGSSLHAGVNGMNRSMRFGAGPTYSYVGYNLYSDAAYSQPYLTTPIAVPAQPITIYGRAIGTGGLSAGLYQDTIAVTLTF